jgi:tRNA(Ile)-lysidine synthase
MPIPLFQSSLFAPGERVLVAISGGPDSLSLLHSVWEHCHELSLAAVEAAHLDHGLRGAESAAEAVWVAAWCAERGIPCHVGLADVGALASARKESKQQAARAVRYAFLEDIAAQIKASAIATAHTEDDQVETVLMNILRGTGLDGLRGIPARRGLFVRPLLGISRAEIEDYCARHSLEPRHDPSNFSTSAYTRNRVRLELLPQLAREYNPAVREALLRLSEIARRDLDYLQAQADAALSEATRERDIFRLVLDRPTLAGLHPALLRHVLRRAVADLRDTGEGLTYDHVEQTCQALTAPAPRAFALTLPYPLCTIRITEETLTLALANVPAPLGNVSVPLPVPGRATLPGTRRQVQASFDPTSGPLSTAELDADILRGDTLTLRNWRRGDRIDPLGMNGRHKKVSDIFTDAKVLREERSQVPIVADEVGIVWVAGHCIAERAKVTAETQRVLYLAEVSQG